MTAAASLNKLMSLSARRVEIAERKRIEAEALYRGAKSALEAAQEALEARRLQVAHEREATLDRFVGRPTRRAGVSDLLQTLRDQDGSVAAAEAKVSEQQSALTAAQQRLDEMTDALIVAKRLEERRSAAFEPRLLKERRLREDRSQKSVEEEFGNARRF